MPALQAAPYSGIFVYNISFNSLSDSVSDKTTKIPVPIIVRSIEYVYGNAGFKNSKFCSSP